MTLHCCKLAAAVTQYLGQVQRHHWYHKHIADSNRRYFVHFLEIGFLLSLPINYWRPVGTLFKFFRSETCESDSGVPCNLPAQILQQWNISKWDKIWKTIFIRLISVMPAVRVKGCSCSSSCKGNPAPCHESANVCQSLQWNYYIYNLRASGRSSINLCTNTVEIIASCSIFESWIMKI